MYISAFILLTKKNHMTEIKIEKKKQVWPWILVLIALIVAALYLFTRNDEEKPIETATKTELIDVRENNAIVADYVAFVNADTNTMTLDHAYSSGALTKLTDAVDAMATVAGYDVKADIGQARQYANDITKDPMATSHANKIKSAAEVLSKSLQNLQQAKYPGLNADAMDVKNAAAAINPETLALDQRMVIKSFFRKASDLLTKMN